MLAEHLSKKQPRSSSGMRHITLTLPLTYTRLLPLQLLNVLLACFLLLLFEDGVSLSDAPVVRAGHGRTERSACCRLHLLPVVPGGPGPHPGLGVHHQPPGPGDVLLTGQGQLPSLLSQLLRDGPDVVRQEAAAASDVADAHVVRLAGEPVHVESDEEISVSRLR